MGEQMVLNLSDSGCHTIQYIVTRSLNEHTHGMVHNDVPYGATMVIYGTEG